jgi:hypothetical protein
MKARRNASKPGVMRGAVIAVAIPKSGGIGCYIAESAVAMIRRVTVVAENYTVIRSL